MECGLKTDTNDYKAENLFVKYKWIQQKYARNKFKQNVTHLFKCPPLFNFESIQQTQHSNKMLLWMDCIHRALNAFFPSIINVLYGSFVLAPVSEILYALNALLLKQVDVVPPY